MNLLPRPSGVGRWVAHRNKGEQDLNDELQAFIEMAAADELRAGATPAEARRAAVLHLGGLEQAKERVRTARHGAWLDELARNVRYGLRQVQRNPGFSAIAIGTLALGIGTSVAVYSLVYAVLLRPYPYEDPERLVRVESRNIKQGGALQGNSLPDIDDFRRRSATLIDVGAYVT